MSTRAADTTAAETSTPGTCGDGTDAEETPARVRGLPSRLLTRSAMHAARLVTDGLAAEGARTWHFVVLVALTRSGPASQSALSRRTGVYRSDMVAVINDLAERGFVDRTRDPEDRRRNVITVTPEGRDHLRRLDAIINRAQDDLLAPLTQAERHTLTGLLTRILDHHTKTTPRTAGN